MSGSDDQSAGKMWEMRVETHPRRKGSQVRLPRFRPQRLQYLHAVLVVCACCVEEPQLCIPSKGQRANQHAFVKDGCAGWPRLCVRYGCDTRTGWLRLRGGGYVEGLDTTDDFTRQLERKLGGRDKAKKTLMNNGFGKLLSDLDEITQSIAPQSSVPGGANFAGAPLRKRKRGEGQAGAEKGRLESKRVSTDERAAYGAEVDEEAGARDSSEEMGLQRVGRPGLKAKQKRAASNLVGVRDRAVAGGIDTRGLFSGLAPVSGKDRDEAKGCTPSLAVKNDTARLPSQQGSCGASWAGGGRAGSSPELRPEVAELVNVARFASSLPLYGLGARCPTLIAPPVPPSSAEDKAVSVQSASSSDADDQPGGLGGVERSERLRTRVGEQAAALRLQKETRLKEYAARGHATIEMPAGGKGIDSLIDRAQPRVPRPTDPGGLEAAKAMLKDAPIETVAQYWRDNFQDLMQLGQGGHGRQKRPDFGRGRGFDHVPAAIAPLLSLQPQAKDPQADFQRTSWYRQFKAEQTLINISKSRTGPAFMDILTKPGWNTKVGDVYEIDDDWNIIPPQDAPELLPAAFASSSADLNHEHEPASLEDDRQQEESQIQSGEEGTGSQEAWQSSATNAGQGGASHLQYDEAHCDEADLMVAGALVSAGKARAPSRKGERGSGNEPIKWKEGEAEELERQLMEADLNDDDKATLGVLERLRLCGRPSMEDVDKLVAALQHAAGKARFLLDSTAAAGETGGDGGGQHSGHAQRVESTLQNPADEDSVPGRDRGERLQEIITMCKEIESGWAGALEGELDRLVSREAIVLPGTKPVRKDKSYRNIKERLRAAGLPTGGKKRKILQRLKALDDRELREARMYDLEAGVGGVQQASTTERRTIVSNGQEECAGEHEDSYEPSQVDGRFAAIYTDPEFALDPSNPSFSFVKGRSHVAQKRFSDLKRFITKDRRRRTEMANDAWTEDEGADQAACSAGSGATVGDLVGLAKRARERLEHDSLAHEQRRSLQPDQEQRNALKDLWGSTSLTSDESAPPDKSVDDSAMAAHGPDSSVEDSRDPSGLDQHQAELGALARPHAEREGNKVGHKERQLEKKRKKKEKEKLRRKRQRERILSHPLLRLRYLRQKDAHARLRRLRDGEDVRLSAGGEEHGFWGNGEERKDWDQSHASDDERESFESNHEGRGHTSNCVGAQGSPDTRSDTGSVMLSGDESYDDGRWEEEEGQEDLSVGAQGVEEKQRRNADSLSQSQKKRQRRKGLKALERMQEGLVAGRQVGDGWGDEQGDLTRLQGLFQRGLKPGGIVGSPPGPSLLPPSRHARLTGRHVASWTVTQVGVWLARRLSSICSPASVSQYVDLFQAFQVSGKELVTLKDEDLEDMGVKSGLLRRDLLGLIDSVGNGQTPAKRLNQQGAICALPDPDDPELGARGGMVIPTGGASGDVVRAVGHGSMLSTRAIGRCASDRPELVNWREELKNVSIGLDFGAKASDIHRLPDDEIFDKPVGRELPCAPLPTVQTAFGELRVYTEQDLKRENAHLDLHGPCPFDCQCCVM